MQTAQTNTAHPEMLAREKGIESTAEVLREWLANKDRDLRAGRGSATAAVKDRRPCGMDALDMKRLHVKQSIDRALNLFKAHSHPLSLNHPHWRIGIVPGW
jgi:hypothetical protein